jgi:hypothetical protein
VGIHSKRLTFLTDKFPYYSLTTLSYDLKMEIPLTANQYLIVTSTLTVIAAFRLIATSNRPYIGLSVRFGVNNFPTLVIQNIGNRTARDIKFRFKRRYKPLLQQLGQEEKPVEGFAPFKNGIAALVPDETAAYVFYMNPETWEKKSATILKVSVSYARKHNRGIFRFKETISLDINDYKSRLIKKHIPE